MLTLFSLHPEHREDFSRALNDMCRDLTKSPIEYYDLEEFSWKGENSKDPVVGHRQLENDLTENPVTGLSDHTARNIGNFTKKRLKKLGFDPGDPKEPKNKKIIGSIIGGIIAIGIGYIIANDWEDTQITKLNNL